MKKIVIFSSFFLPHLGGVERYTDKLSKELINNGYEVVIVTSNHDNLQEVEKRKGLKVYRLPVYNLFKNRFPILKYNKDYRRIMKLVDKEDADYVIVNSRFYLNSLNGAKYSKRNSLPLYFIEHGSSHMSVGNKLLDYFGSIYEHIITWKIKKYNGKFYGVSKRCNEWLKHFSIEASGVFYNSIDGDAFFEYKNKVYNKNLKDKIIICYAGRIIKEKGVDLLVNAFNNISPKYKDVVLLIAGEGPLLNELKENNKNDSILFEGKLDYDAIMRLYSQSDIFVHPSQYPEGLPTVILEAGLMKNAIVATDRGGTIEVINDKNIGIIVEENQKDLEEKIIKMLNNRNKIEKYKNAIHDRILKEFTWKVTAQRVIEELEKEQ